MMVRATVTIACLAMLAGCGNVLRIGRLTDPSRLEASLKAGVSTHDDVRRELGAPRSGGAALLPGWDRPRDVWFYYYEEGSAADDRRCMVYVFFDAGKYDGYLWFSSLTQPPPAPANPVTKDRGSVGRSPTL